MERGMEGRSDEGSTDLDGTLMITHTDTGVTVPADVHGRVGAVLDLFLTHRWRGGWVALSSVKVIKRTGCVKYRNMVTNDRNSKNF